MKQEPKHLCPVCQTEIPPTKWKNRKRIQYKKFCSLRCKGEEDYKRRKPYYKNYWLTRPHLFKWKKEKECRWCKKLFVMIQPNQEFCRPQCSKYEWKKHHRKETLEWQRNWKKKKAREDWQEKECAYCKIIFLPDLQHKRQQIYCSKKCQQKINAKKSAEKILYALKHPNENPEFYWKVLRRKQVQDANYKALKRGCKYENKNCTKEHIHLKDWQEILQKMNHHCAICGKKETIDCPMTIDHIVAISNGGSNTKENIQPTCRPCNSRKGNRW